MGIEVCHLVYPKKLWNKFMQKFYILHLYIIWIAIGP